MKVTIISNGHLLMAITPETEIEKLQLKELFKSPVEATITDTAQILGKNIADSVIITTKTPTDGK